MFDWLCSLAPAIAVFIAGFVEFIVSFIRTGSIKKSLKEVSDLKYRLPNYRENEKAEEQSFSSLEPEYKLDKKTNTLKVVGQRDVQAEIDSYKDVALERILDKFLPQLESSDDILDYPEPGSPLDYLIEAQELADDYRERYNLSDSLSAIEIFRKIAEAAAVQPVEPVKPVQGEGDVSDEKA